MIVQKLTLFFESVDIEVKMLTTIIFLSIRNVLLHIIHLKLIKKY